MSDELRIEYIPLGKATLFEDNAKLHDIGSLVTSVRRYGFRDAVIYDEALGAIVAGNGRIEALAMMKQGGEEAPRGIKVEDGEWLVPVQFGVNALSVVEAKAFALDHNNITMLGGDFSPWDVAQMWDSDGYMALLGELAEADVLPISVTGEDIDALLAGFGAEEAGEDVPPQIDKGAELAERYGVETGQIWALGEHRLACGDCTDRAVVEALMKREKAGAVVTDPPYGIEREGILNDDPGGLGQLYGGCLATMPVDNAVVIAFQSPRLFPVWLDAIREAGYKFERSLWYHETGKSAYPWHGWYMRADTILVSSIGSPSWNENPPEGSQDTYTHHIGQDKDGQLVPVGAVWTHSAVKPLWVIQDLVGHTVGDVYDPFVGSGTTIIACQNLGRRCYACEVSPSYCGVAIQRWEDLTGEEPKLLS
jgi:hypothetical protein